MGRGKAKRRTATSTPEQRRADMQSRPRNCILRPNEFLWRANQKNVPGPAAELSIVNVFHLRAVTEPISVLISSLRFLVIEFKGLETKLGEVMQLIRFRDAVVICILPELKTDEDGVMIIDHAVSIAAVRRLVVFRQRKEAILIWVGRLRRKVAKQFSSAIDLAVAVRSSTRKASSEPVAVQDSLSLTWSELPSKSKSTPLAASVI